MNAVSCQPGRRVFFHASCTGVSQTRRRLVANPKVRCRAQMPHCTGAVLGRDVANGGVAELAAARVQAAPD